MTYSAHNPRPLPSLDFLRECFDYNTETGVLTRKARPVHHFSDGVQKTAEQLANHWNNAWAGKVAGYKSKAGCIAVKLEGVEYKAHRLAYYIATGQEPFHIDHISGDATDNRLCNLRAVSHQENHKNQKLRVTNTSGVMGVKRHSQCDAWVAQIGGGKERRHLGFFRTFQDAVLARKSAERDAGYHENHGRV